MPHATFVSPDLTTFTRLDELGLEVVGQFLEPKRAVLACRVVDPFVPQRFFTVFGVPSRDIRGQHAHRRCEQFLVCLSGSVTCLIDDGTQRRTVVLDNPSVGLHAPAMTWGAQYNYSADAVLGVFASLPYDPDDYIRDYEDFLSELQAGDTR